MPFIFNHAGKKLDLEDLPLERWTRIQEVTGLTWPEVLSGKVLGDSKVTQVVLAQVAEHLEITLPALTIRSAMELIKWEREPNIPETFNEGMPDPKAPASEQATT
jgi:hypothetical protein